VCDGVKTTTDNMKANARPEEINLFINAPYSVLLSRGSQKNLAIIGEDYRMSTSKLRVRPSGSSIFRTATTSTLVRPVKALTRSSIRPLSPSFPTTSGVKTTVVAMGLGCAFSSGRSPLANQLFGVKKIKIRMTTHRRSHCHVFL